MKKLWERALANRAYWDNYQIAADGFRAKAKLEAQLEARRETQPERRKSWKKEDPAVRARYKKETRKKVDAEVKSRRPPALSIEPVKNELVAQCIACHGPLERRPGVKQLVHAGKPCTPTGVHLPRLGKIPHCKEPVFRLGAERPCGYAAGPDGLCALHRGRAARAAITERSTGNG